MNNIKNIKVKSVLRSAGSSATRSIVCGQCGCRGQNLVSFDNGTSGYACKWNGHATYVFPARPTYTSHGWA